jgi:hypothetical protein
MSITEQVLHISDSLLLICLMSKCREFMWKLSVIRPAQLEEELSFGEA